MINEHRAAEGRQIWFLGVDDEDDFMSETLKTWHLYHYDEATETRYGLRLSAIDTFEESVAFIYKYSNDLDVFFIDFCLSRGTSDVDEDRVAKMVNEIEIDDEYHPLYRVRRGETLMPHFTFSLTQDPQDIKTIGGLFLWAILSSLINLSRKPVLFYTGYADAASEPDEAKALGETYPVFFITNVDVQPKIFKKADTERMRQTVFRFLTIRIYEIIEKDSMYEEKVNNLLALCASHNTEDLIDKLKKTCFAGYLAINLLVPYTIRLVRRFKLDETLKEFKSFLLGVGRDTSQLLYFIFRCCPPTERLSHATYELDENAMTNVSMDIEKALTNIHNLPLTPDVRDSIKKWLEELKLELPFWNRNEVNKKLRRHIKAKDRFRMDFTAVKQWFQVVGRELVSVVQINPFDKLHCIPEEIKRGLRTIIGEAENLDYRWTPYCSYFPFSDEIDWIIAIGDKGKGIDLNSLYPPTGTLTKALYRLKSHCQIFVQVRKKRKDEIKTYYYNRPGNGLENYKNYFSELDHFDKFETGTLFLLVFKKWKGEYERCL